MNSIDYFFGRLIRFSILFFILYMIFTNFGTFLIVITVFIILGYYFIYKKIQKIREQQSHFQFHFNAKDFQQGAQGFRFEDFQNFQSGNFQAQPQFGEVQKAKEFFDLHTPLPKRRLKKGTKSLQENITPILTTKAML